MLALLAEWFLLSANMNEGENEFNTRKMTEFANVFVSANHVAAAYPPACMTYYPSIESDQTNLEMTLRDIQFANDFVTWASPRLAAAQQLNCNELYAW